MLIILDRDGVINVESEAFVKSKEEWVPIPGSIEAIADLCAAGHQVVVATNQSGVGRELFSLEILQAMHQKMLRLVTQAGGHIDHIYFCPHHPDDQCDCRKPKPGMFHKILNDYNVPGHDCWLVGDSMRDLEAGAAVGCRLALVKTGKGEKTLAQLKDAKNIAVFDDLNHFAVVVNK